MGVRRGGAQRWIASTNQHATKMRIFTNKSIPKKRHAWGGMEPRNRALLAKIKPKANNTREVPAASAI